MKKRSGKFFVLAILALIIIIGLNNSGLLNLGGAGG